MVFLCILMTIKIEILQIHCGEIHRERQQCIDSVRRAYKGYPYRMITGPDFDDVRQRVAFSDWLRLKMLSDNPNMLYIDTDIYMEKPFTDFPLKGKPYMLHPFNNCMIYANNCCEWFKQFILTSLANGNFGRVVTCNMYSHIDVYPIVDKSIKHISGSGAEKHWHQI